MLGSATPSMEAMYRARRGEYVLFEMKNRSRMQQMAEVYTVDMREELKNGNRSILSTKLKELMIFGLYLLPGMRSCGEVPSLRCVALCPQRREDALPLLRV